MPKPRQCPKCKTPSENISNTKDFYSLFNMKPEVSKEWFCNECGYNFDDNEILEKNYAEEANKDINPKSPKSGVNNL